MLQILCLLFNEKASIVRFQTSGTEPDGNILWFLSTEYIERKALFDGGPIAFRTL